MIRGSSSEECWQYDGCVTLCMEQSAASPAKSMGDVFRVGVDNRFLASSCAHACLFPVAAGSFMLCTIVSSCVVVLYPIGSRDVLLTFT